MVQDRDRELGSQALTDALQASFRLLQLAMLGMLIYILCTGIYVVKQHEVAVVLRLGKVVGTKADRIRQPGLHIGFPYPIDEVIRIPVQRVLTVESETHWYRLTQEEKEAKERGEALPSPDSLRPLVDGYTLTGDANILHSRWALRYRVVDPVHYALDFGEDAIETFLRDALDNAVLRVSSRFTADAALRTDVDRFREEVQKAVTDTIQRHHLGCSVQRVDLIEVAPPRQVKDAFDAVIAAEQDRSRLISEAQAYASRVVSQARGTGSRVVSSAEALRTRTVQDAAADADYFHRVLPRFQQNPQVMRRLLWLDTLHRVLEGADEKWIVRQGEELRLQLNRDPKVLAEESRKALEKQSQNSEEQEHPEDLAPPPDLGPEVPGAP